MKRVLCAAAAACAAVLVGKALVALPAIDPNPPPLAEPLQIGDIVSGEIHAVERPGVYGLAYPPDGSRYAIVGNNLVRLNRETGQIQAVIRSRVRPVSEATLP